MGTTEQDINILPPTVPRMSAGLVHSKKARTKSMETCFADGSFACLAFFAGAAAAAGAVARRPRLVILLVAVGTG